jgi:hypothetical protein
MGCYIASNTNTNTTSTCIASSYHIITVYYRAIYSNTHIHNIIIRPIDLATTTNATINIYSYNNKYRRRRSRRQCSDMAECSIKR